MQREQALQLLRAGTQGVAAWNAWKRANPNVRVELASAHLSGLDMRGIDLSEVSFQGSHFCRTNLARATLRKCHFAAVHFEGANLERADLEHAQLQRAQLSGAMMAGVYLQSANLTHARLDGADLRGAYLGGANLKGASLYGADLRGAHLEGTHLAGAHFEGADLRNVDLSASHIVGAHIEGAIREGELVSDARERRGHDMSVALRIHAAPGLVPGDFVELFQRLDDLSTTVFRLVAARLRLISDSHLGAHMAIGMGGDPDAVGLQALAQANSAYRAWTRGHLEHAGVSDRPGASATLPPSEMVRVGQVENDDGALIEVLVRRGHPVESVMSAVCQACVDVWDRELTLYRKSALPSSHAAKGARPLGISQHEFDPAAALRGSANAVPASVAKPEVAAHVNNTPAPAPAPARRVWDGGKSPYSSMLDKPGLWAGGPRTGGPTPPRPARPDPRSTATRVNTGVQSFFSTPVDVDDRPETSLPYIAPRDDMPAVAGPRPMPRTSSQGPRPMPQAARVGRPPAFAPGATDYVAGEPDERGAMSSRAHPCDIPRPASSDELTRSGGLAGADARPPAQAFSRKAARKALQDCLGARELALPEDLVRALVDHLTAVVLATWRSPGVRHLQQPALARNEAGPRTEATGPGLDAGTPTSAVFGAFAGTQRRSV